MRDELAEPVIRSPRYDRGVFEVSLPVVVAVVAG